SGPPTENSDAPARPLSVPAPSRSPFTTACGRGVQSSFEFVIVPSFQILIGLLADPAERVAAVDQFTWRLRRARANAESNSQPGLPDGTVSGVEGLAALGICVVLRRLATIVFPVVAH